MQILVYVYCTKNNCIHTQSIYTGFNNKKCLPNKQDIKKNTHKTHICLLIPPLKQNKKKEIKKNMR